MLTELSFLMSLSKHDQKDLKIILLSGVGFKYEKSQNIYCQNSSEITYIHFINIFFIDFISKIRHHIRNQNYLEHSRHVIHRKGR